MGKVIPFIAGAAVGALAALAFAPQAGEQTRALVTEKANAVIGEAKDLGAQVKADPAAVFSSVQERGAAFAKAAQEQAGTVQQAVTDRVKEVRGQAAPSAVDSDELREKIEAARRRIAAQVMENAEQSKAVETAAEAVEEAKEAVEEAAEEAAEAAEEAAEE